MEENLILVRDFCKKYGLDHNFVVLAIKNGKLRGKKLKMLNRGCFWWVEDGEYVLDLELGAESTREFLRLNNLENDVSRDFLYSNADKLIKRIYGTRARYYWKLRDLLPLKIIIKA